MGRIKHFLIIAHDAAAIFIAFLGAYWLRFNLTTIPLPEVKTLLTHLTPLLIIQLTSYRFFGFYRGIWRYASLVDLVRIIESVVVAVIITSFIYVILGYNTIPRSILPVYTLLMIIILGGSRFAYRAIRERTFGKKIHGLRVLIMGAGNAGEILLRDIMRDPLKRYDPILFIDDDRSKDKREIHGIPIAGTLNDLVSLTKKYNIELILIAIPSANSILMKKLIEMCEETALPFKTLPSLTQLTEKEISLTLLREVSIEDLLGRQEITLEWPLITQAVEKKSVLITGGGGSIGSELCRQVAHLNPTKLIVLDASEYNLYQIEMDIRKKFPTLTAIFLLTNITDQLAIESIFQHYTPEIVFHAAAYKHVPILEEQVRVAAMNNVLGTWQLAETAAAHNVEKFVLVSTDKAVNPANIMGMTKRFAEIICQSHHHVSKTKFITVRFGNVLGSAGSVVPLFKKQLAEGGPITVTHPEITRYFMTITEASQLILQAMAMSQNNEILVLDMGEPIKISQLAEQMIKLSGLKVNEEIKIVYTGLRPGEKLFEELFHQSEDLQATHHPKILLAYPRQYTWEEVKKGIYDVTTACKENNEEAVKVLLHGFVPEYHTPSIEYASDKVGVSSMPASK